jgi:hypothetical protein
VVVVVLNSNDSFDVPTYAPMVGVLPDYPDHRPLLALEEAADRYIIPRLRFGTGKMEEAPSLDKPARQSDVDESLTAVRELIELARSSGARVIVAQHLERAERAASRSLVMPRSAKLRDRVGLRSLGSDPHFAMRWAPERIRISRCRTWCIPMHWDSD